MPTVEYVASDHCIVLRRDARGLLMVRAGHEIALDPDTWNVPRHLIPVNPSQSDEWIAAENEYRRKNGLAPLDSESGRAEVMSRLQRIEDRRPFKPY